MKLAIVFVSYLRTNFKERREKVGGVGDRTEQNNLEN
jgi:hypothetical protein